MMTAAKRRSSKAAAPARPWTDDEVVGVLTAEMLLTGARLAVPGFESLRELAREYEAERAGYITAVSERYPTVDRKREALRSVAGRIVAAPIDWKAAADRISSERQEFKIACPEEA